MNRVRTNGAGVSNRPTALLLGALVLFGCADARNGGAAADAAAVPDAGDGPAGPPPVDAGPDPDAPDASRLGAFGAPCEENRDCLSSYCVESPLFGRICTQTCGDCPPGFECQPIANGGPDMVFVCLSDQPDLCEPCETDLECDDNADLCVTLGRNRYCAEDCAESGFCPDGYACVDVDRGDAGVARQCVPANGEGCLPCRDDDADGYGDGGDCLGFDCDDADPAIHAGAAERCNGRDDDCDSLVDEPDELGPAPGDRVCLAAGVCAGTRATCTGGDWRCDYPATYRADADALCDGIDNDCDGATDEDFDLRGDVANCGFCGNACAFANAGAACSAGACAPGPCDAGWHDVDGNAGNGCEYLCAREADPPSAAIERCDGIDNDCDGDSDEDFDLATRLEHCGECGNACAFDHAAAACVDGQCVRRDCDAGWVDANGSDDDGCEYACVAGGVAPSPETCDGADNDCDGSADEGFDVLADPANCGRCGQACALDNATARCDLGSCRIAQCAGGFFDEDERPENGCEYPCQPTNDGVEACDAIDNDCDGAADEDFALATDLANCGACGVACAFPAAVAECVDGDCAFVACVAGFSDLNADLADGCELECVQQNGGVEACNAVDDDCDARIDEGQLNACGGCGPVPVESCNGLDDDCNGIADDHGACGPYVAARCRLYLGWADTRRGPVRAADSWGGCPPADRANAGDVRCTSTRGDERFGTLDLSGDVNDDDQLAVALRGEDPDAPDLAAWVQSRCALFLGHADVDRGPDGSPTWGPCPGVAAGEDARMRCTSSGFDGRFRAMNLPGDVDGNDDLGLAWICRDAADPGRAAAVTAAVEVFAGWADANRGPPDGSVAWGPCPVESSGELNGQRCVGTGGDGLFHRLDLAGDVNGDDDLGIAVRARPAP